jgi:hypothetical protein
MGQSLSYFDNPLIAFDDAVDLVFCYVMGQWIAFRASDCEEWKSSQEKEKDEF